MTLPTDNVIKAKVSTHIVAIAGVVIALYIRHFINDPHAITWLNNHWFVKNLVEFVQVGIAPVAAYLTPTSQQGDKPNV